ncbi:type II toxin-antitoxin system VapC family toxin [Pyrodictium abyssi]|uniref:type II toxin-antitoxin system VapC family toxin n=1 Tax=Pyrodictium abyssi TaxID=54256 RepID=UPI0030C6B933
MVLDSSVLVKSVLRPGRWLPSNIYRRELETHRKARMVIRLLRDREYEVLLPYPVIVETGAVISRLAGEKLAREIVESLKSTRDYTIVFEEEIREDALEVAIRTGSSGFDAYIIALAWRRNAILVTDDEAMSMHASRIGARALLLRAVPEKELERII